MITNFKLFEKEGDIFNIGTWVLLEIDLESPWAVYPYVKIIGRNSNKFFREDDEDELNDYKVESFNLETGEITEFWVDDFDIDRELTEEEIKDVKLILQRNKYNL